MEKEIFIEQDIRSILEIYLFFYLMDLHPTFLRKVDRLLTEGVMKKALKRWSHSNSILKRQGLQREMQLDLL